LSNYVAAKIYAVEDNDHDLLSNKKLY